MSVEDQIEELVKSAALANCTQLLDALYRALDSIEVYYQATFSVADGKQLINTPLLRLQDGTFAMRVYTSKRHPDLAQMFASSSWRHALQFALNNAQADWLIVINLDGNRVGINRRQVPVILDILSSEPTNHSSGRKSAKTPSRTLESLISNADRHPAETRYESIVAQLTRRKLYIPLGPELSESGQPVMITSKVGDISGLVQAYTSRSRPGITFGAMTWEAIVQMVKNNPDLPGVHVINDNDDWIVLGRSDITTAN